MKKANGEEKEKIDGEMTKMGLDFCLIDAYVPISFL